MSEEFMTIRQMCDAFEVTPRALRFYESKELLFPVRDGQKRLFSRRDRARLKLLLRGKRFGFSLEEIRQLLDLYAMKDQDQSQISQAVVAARTRIAEMISQRDDLSMAIEELAKHINWGEDQLAQTQAESAA